MNLPSENRPEDALAVKRFYILNGVRLAGIASLLVGLMITQNVISAPYPLGVVLALGGAAGFFFGPYFLAKKWTSEGTDRDQ